MKKKTDGGHAIPEEDLREMEQEEGREMPEGVESQTGYCRFCGQGGVVHTMMGWGQDEVNEAVTCRCQCEEAKKYAESKERVQKAKSRIEELFSSTAEKPIDQSVVNIMFRAVDAIEEKAMKGITIDVGQGIKARVSKMAKESIKVERSEVQKKTYEEWGGQRLERMDADIKAVARSIIQGNEKRKKRIKAGKASSFDVMAAAVVEDALCSSCQNIESIQARRQMQKRIYESIVYNTPYEYIADALCGRRQFYEYRTEFITRVAQAMDMLPGGKGEDGNERD